MKSYTDIEQSKKLSEILPRDTADNTYERVVIDGCNLDISEEQQYVHRDIPFTLFSGIGIPCWSLAALLEIIQKKGIIITLRNSPFFQNWSISCDIYDIWKQCKGDTLIDAVYEMIMWLKENKHI